MRYPSIFISHNQKDKNFAQSLKKFFYETTHDIDVWLSCDPTFEVSENDKDLNEWHKEAILHTDVFIQLYTPACLNWRNCFKEYSVAIHSPNLNLKTIVFCFGNGPVPELISNAFMFNVCIYNEILQFLHQFFNCPECFPELTGYTDKLDFTYSEHPRAIELYIMILRVLWPARSESNVDIVLPQKRKRSGPNTLEFYKRKLNVPAKVDCAIFAPPATAPGKNIMLQVFAYSKYYHGEIGNIEKLAKEYDDGAKVRGTKRLEHEVELDLKITFYLSMRGVEIDEPFQHLIWREEAEAVQFGIHIPKRFPPQDLVGTVFISHNSVPLGHIKFLLKVEADNSAATLNAKKDINSTLWQRYNTAFISYASSDRAEVLKRVQMLPRCFIHVFIDLLTLEPGERWEKELYKYIDGCDVFFLFWSTAAKNSEWVLKEVQYALKIKREVPLENLEIIPVIIEGPPPIPPPPELAHLHFNDTFIYFINAQ